LKLRKGISAHHHRELETPEPRRFAHCIMRRVRAAKLSKEYDAVQRRATPQSNLPIAGFQYGKHVAQNG
jgi:hypothetical protein